MHEIECKQPRRKQRKLGTLEHALAERIHQGNHCNAEQRTHDSPTEGIHAEYRNADGNDYFSERRMRNLVDTKIMQMFICGSCVVELIEIHAGHVTRVFRHAVLFIDKSRCGCIVHRYMKQVACRVKERKLVYPCFAAHNCQRDVFCCAVQAAVANPPVHCSETLVDFD